MIIKLCEKHQAQADKRFERVCEHKSDASDEWWESWWKQENERAYKQAFYGCCLRERIGEAPAGVRVGWRKMIDEVAKKHGH